MEKHLESPSASSLDPNSEMQSEHTTLRLGGSQLWLAASALLALLFWRADNYVSDWKFTHFLFNYEFEFVKRGLIGEALRMLGWVNYDTVVMLSYAVVLLLAVLLSVIWLRPFRQSQQRLGLGLFALVAMTSPMSIQHLVYDLGRYDVYIALLSLLAILALPFTRGWGAAILVVACLVPAILIHEAVFFIYAPLVFCYWYWCEPEHRALPEKVAAFLLVFGLTFWVSTQGLVTKMDYSQHLQLLQSSHGERVIEPSLQVLHKGGLAENMAMTLKSAIKPLRIVHHGIMLLLLAPLFYWFWLVFKQLKPQLNLASGLLLLAAVSPLALYPIGHDHFRWWSLAACNLFVALALLMQQAGPRDAIAELMVAKQRLVWVIVASALVLGPLAITSSFDSVVDFARWGKSLLG